MADLESYQTRRHSQPLRQSKEELANVKNLEGALTRITPVTSAHNEAKPGSNYTPLQWLLIVLAVYSSALFYGLETTIVAVIQDPVIARFGDVEKLGWLGIGFPLGFITTIAAWSKAYSMFDTK